MRCPGHDYAAGGVYFITIKTNAPWNPFGLQLRNGVRLNEAGRIAREEWVRTSALRPGVRLDAHVIMPDHMHALLVIHRSGTIGAAREKNAQTLPSGSLGAIVTGYKSAVTRRIRNEIPWGGLFEWQRDYHDRIVRDPGAIHHIRKYIQMNPYRHPR